MEAYLCATTRILFAFLAIVQSKIMGVSKLINVIDVDFVKKLCMINWLPKSMLLILGEKLVN